MPSSETTQCTRGFSGCPLPEAGDRIRVTRVATPEHEPMFHVGDELEVLTAWISNGGGWSTGPEDEIVVMPSDVNGCLVEALGDRWEIA